MSALDCRAKTQRHYGALKTIKSYPFGGAAERSAAEGACAAPPPSATFAATAPPLIGKPEGESRGEKLSDAFH
jgi:hypothetical protein